MAQRGSTGPHRWKDAPDFSESGYGTLIDAGATNVRQLGRECPWGRAPVGRPTCIGNAGLNKSTDRGGGRDETSSDHETLASNHVPTDAGSAVAPIGTERASRVREATVDHDDAKAKLQKAIGDLNARIEATKKKLHGLESTTSTAWGDMKAGVDKALDALQNAYDKAAERFK